MKIAVRTVILDSLFPYKKPFTNRYSSKKRLNLKQIIATLKTNRDARNSFCLVCVLHRDSLLFSNSNIIAINVMVYIIY